MAPCYRPLRRFLLYTITLLVPLTIVTCSLFLLWHLHLLTLSTTTTPSALNGHQQYYTSLRNTLQGMMGEETSEDNNLNQRVVADLEAKCGNEAPREDLDEDRPTCPCVPPSLVGPTLDLRFNITEHNVIDTHPEVMSGGRWRPAGCVARQRLCVLVPYRNRLSHLLPFMDYLHTRLQRQQRDYSVYLIEQSDGSGFNRGLLLNVGFRYATNMTRGRPCDCVVLHDLDMTSEDDRNLYMCPPTGGALHLAAYRKHLNYSLPYVGYFGGITALGVADYRAANGYSNMYFGWGSEDDEFLQRLFATGVKLMRHLPEVSRVRMMEHAQSTANRERFMLYLRWKDRWATDGLRSIGAVVNVTQAEERPLYTWVKVEVNEAKVKAVTSELMYQARD